MGQTSALGSLAELEAAYASLPNKRTKKGAALRRKIAEVKALEATAPSDAPLEDVGIVPPSLSEGSGNDIEVSSSGNDPESGLTAGSTMFRVQAGVKSSEVAPVPDADLSGEEMGILPDLREIEDTQRSAIYWVGVIPGEPGTRGDPSKGVPSRPAHNLPPRHTIDGLGGKVSFAEYFTPHEGTGHDGAHRRGQYFGNLVRLTEAMVVDLRKGMRSSVVRWRVREGRHAHGSILRIPSIEEIESVRERLGLTDREVARLRIKADQFRHDPHDEPAAKYVYCVKVSGPEAVEGGSWRPITGTPPSVLERKGIESP